ncbi:MAG: hypothetical protein A2Y10_20270 [Planctomycetes bacterium GWF2_41_51]|nr:MAG: hypothetical protein A2Y10_20270 [Planctomycetes bacterium GWF2_41_51]HBG25749.1 hypothetical protein [Phycisphaerales bacterium]
MARRKNLSTRGEIQDNIAKQHDEMDESLDDLGIKAEDTETVRETLDSLDMEGFTAEGSVEVEDSIEKAEDVTVELFDREDGNLEQIIEKAEDYTEKLGENQESVQKDLSKVSDASAEIETKETVNELAHTKASAIEDMEFLEQRENEAKEDQDQTEQARKELQQRINSGRGK